LEVAGGGEVFEDFDADGAGGGEGGGDPQGEKERFGAHGNLGDTVSNWRFGLKGWGGERVVGIVTHRLTRQ
jgi:hypothetical protein